MKKAKKILTGFVLSTIITSPAIVASTNFKTNTIDAKVDNSKIEAKTASSRANHTVNFDNHTIDGVSLRRSDELLTRADSGWNIYTNCGSDGTFPNNQPILFNGYNNIFITTTI